MRPLLYASAVLLAIVAVVALSVILLFPPEAEDAQALRSLAGNNDSEPSATTLQSEASPTARPDLPPLRRSAPESVEALIEEAQEVAEHLVECFPDNPDAFEMKGRLHSWLGNTAAAAGAWQRCLELDPTYNYALHGLGGIAAERGEYDEAVRIYRRALQNDARCPTSQLELAKSLLALGQVEEAVELLQQKLHNNPHSIEGFVQLGMAYLQQQEFEKAKQSYKAAARLSPNYSAAHFGLATAFTRLGREEDARRHREIFQELHAVEREQRSQDRIQYDDLEATRVDLATIYTGVGQVYLTQGNAVAAELLWERASLLAPQDIDSRQARAWLYLQQGQPLETIRMLQQLAELEPYNSSYPLEIARLYVTLDRPNDAERTLLAYSESAPADDAGPAALAELYLQTDQKPNEAIALSKAAVERAPTAENYVLLGAAYERSQEWEDAVAAMEKAIELEPENVRYRQFLELLLERAEGEVK